QNRELLARIGDPAELARLRAEMGRAVYRRLADHQQEGHHLWKEVAALRAELEGARRPPSEPPAEAGPRSRWWRP
ncbi:MAG: hypothetical protein QOF17_969, partial [Solirubrobacteraceae bacterium]|nr:hypothetical protein [Solirubrobacteraceae bacterium]